jgi:drug/metabolite transporter (DMT)-like permease
LKNARLKFILIGISFALLWASASAAGKFGLKSVEPLTFFTYRFLVAGVILIAFAHGLMHYRMPKGKEWWQVTVFGAFNTSLYLGIFIIALQYVAAGITTMAIALNPLLISIMSSVVMKRKVLGKEWVGILIGMVGVALATYPLVSSGHSTIGGVLLIVLCMVMYSAGSVYYSTITWELQRTTINAWQVFIGGLMLAPFAVALHQDVNSYDLRFWLSLTWLVIPVSIGAVQLWLRLLKEDTVRASIWLFLCPVFGLVYATFLLDEPFTIYTAVGAVFVIVALYIGQSKR